MKLKSSILALTAAVGLVAGLLPAALPEATPPAAAAVTLPPTIPSLDGWAAGSGEWTLTPTSKIVAPASFAPQAATFAAELDIYLNPPKAQTATRPARPGAIAVATTGADADDIVVTLDPARATQLGTEGYELKVAATGVSIVAADARGAFYGTRSMSQMLRQQLTLPAGSVVDKPKYEERGVTLCACVINIQPDFIDRMLTDMADLKLNHLLLEMKLQTPDPRNNTWSYYTKEDVKRLVAKARVLGIDVIPEINSPGHLGIWLKHRPDLQLKNNAGTRQPEQLDISHPDALAFYTGLIDQYADAFDTKYWHMGADEYMIGTSFANYTALTNWAKATYGANATIGDAFIAFINQVNAHVKSKDKQLRIWNDGVIATQVVQLDRDIVIEHWYSAGLPVATLFERGYEVLNASQSLYFSRSATVYKVKSQNLWTSNWNVGKFSGTATAVDPDHPQLRGAKVSIWPDTSFYQTENEVEAEVFESLRFITQLTWQGDHHDAAGVDMDWATFRAAVDKVGRNPLWLNVDRQPLANGIYKIKLGTTALALNTSGTGVVTGSGAEQWELTASPDYYYQLRSVATGKCLAVATGTKSLGVVTQIGARPELVTCVDPAGTDRATAEARNVQKWQLIPGSGGLTVRNALTNQDLATIKGTEKSIDFSATPATDPTLADQTLRPATGTIVQLPFDLTDDVWAFEQQAGASATISPAIVYPGQDATVTVTVRANAGTALTGVVVTPRAAPGYTFTPAKIDLGTVAAGGSATATFTVAGGTTLGASTLTFDVASSGGAFSPTVTVSSTCGPDFTPKAVAADSQQLTGEKAGSGPFTAAFDGDPTSFWHSQWSPSNLPYPHWLTMDAGAPTTLCALNYLPRNDSANGRVKTYNIYVSTDGTNWGTPIKSGELPDVGTLHRISFTAPVVARYVKFEGLSAYNGSDAIPDVWMTAGEISLTGAKAGGTASPTPTPTETVSPTGSPTPTATVTVTPTATVTTTVNPTVTTTATATATTTATAKATVTATVGTTASATVTATVTGTSGPTATSRPTPSGPVLVAPYEVPGYHSIGGRQWFTECEPYGSTFRCRTNIWATQVVYENGRFVQKTGWHFNNMTYPPYLTREQWGNNPLAKPGTWEVAGRQWYTECDTATTGTNNCRSYIRMQVIVATPKAGGGHSYSHQWKWQLNNIVRFAAS